MTKNEEKALKITYLRKNPDICPICEEEFFVEELFTGGGRLIASKITDELRRLYDVNPKYGLIIPLVYSVIVCPHCYYAVFNEDFLRLNDKTKARIQDFTEERINTVNTLYPGINFNDDRNIEHGLCSYMLAMSCYSFFDKKFSPSLKRAVCSLRINWICNDMAEHYKEPKFKFIGDMFYKKSARYWGTALDLSQSGKEPIDNKTYIGPDTDNNYGYDGLLYLTAFINYNVHKNDPINERKGKLFLKIRRIIAKMYGGGKSSKDKPQIILNLSKDFYDMLGKEIKKIETKLGHEITA